MSSDQLPQIIVAQQGVRNHYAVPIALHQRGLLAHFFTDFYTPKSLVNIFQSSFLSQMHLPWLKKLFARYTEFIPSSKVTCFPLLWIMTLFKNRIALDFTKINQNYQWSHRIFAKKLNNQNFKEAKIIYTNLDEGFKIFIYPKSAKLFKITEVMISPNWHNMIIEEQKLWPGWQDNFNEQIFKKMATDDLFRFLQHLKISDLIICPSEYVLNDTIEYGANKDICFVVPYGYKYEHININEDKLSYNFNNNDLLRILYVGGVTLGKGIQYLNYAIDLIKSKNIYVNVVGSVGLSKDAVSCLNDKIKLHGAVPRPEVDHFYKKSDLLIFPSICDSFGLVQLEALSNGLPVIATKNAGSVVRDGVDGFIVPIRSPEAIAEKIDLLASSPQLRQWMSNNARERAKEFSLEKYGERLSNCILENYFRKNQDS